MYNTCQRKKCPSKNIFCHDSGFVLFICKSCVIHSFEVCSLGWMALSPGYFVPSLCVWIMQPVTVKQSMCTGFPLSLKYPVHVCKSLCTHRMGLLMSWSSFIVHLLCSFQTKIFRSGTKRNPPFVEQGWILQVMSLQSRCSLTIISAWCNVLP